MPRFPTPRQVLWAFLTSVTLSIPPSPAPVSADGLLEAISNTGQETTFSLLSTKTTDVSGTVTRFDAASYVSRSNLRLNYNLLPNLNLNAGGSYEKNLSVLSIDKDDTETEITRIRPFAWLTLRDPVIGAAVGYDRTDDTVETSGEATTLTRDTYNARLAWRPLDLPSTEARYTRSLTHDGDRVFLDTEQDHYYVKSEYLYRGLTLRYTGNLIAARDNLQDSDSTLISHEGKLLYTTTFLDGRIAVTTENDIRSTEIRTRSPAALTAFGNAFLLQQPAVAGLSATSGTVSPITLAANAALIDGDTATSAGLNIGSSQAGGVLRQVGLDFGSAVAVGRLLVWVTGFGPSPPPAGITTSFSWDIYTSADNLTWTLHATVAPAAFGPFDLRFVIDFPTTTTRYIKAVTAPLPLAVPSSGSFPNIFIAEAQAFETGTTGAGGTGGRQQTITRTVRTHHLEVKAILFRSPSLYYRFTGDFEEFQPDDERRYGMSHGLFLTHRLTPIFTVSANTTLELGTERNNTQRTAVLYYAALGATPLKTLTNNLVFSGRKEHTDQTTTSSNSLVLYNTAQLYQGIDATLNLGAVLTSNEEERGADLRRREYYVNIGTAITPNPRVALTTYYLGKLSQASGGATGEREETTEHRLDLGLLLTPFRAVVLSATANIESQTHQKMQVTQNYGLSWAPFPDGSLQFSFSYIRSRLPQDTQSEIIQPTVRWYFAGGRRSYLEATYQHNTSKTSTARTESRLFSTTLNLYY
jgi:hypothetical protein